jgi:predicted SnoaL-like aldol condensation-catalyzing enzyme
MDELFNDKDATAVDRWVASDNRQHNAAPDGPEPMRQIVASFPEAVRYENVRAIADGDLVALHGIYHGFGPDPFVALDLVRVDEDGKLAEHWDALTPVVQEAASGRSQIDGPTTPRDLDKDRSESAPRCHVRREGPQGRRLLGADGLHLRRVLCAAQPDAADCLDGFTAAAAAWAEQGKSLIYKTVHKVVAEGDVVLLPSEGQFGVPVAYWDLFRVADEKIVEHWDVVAPIPSALPHDNGVF